MQRDGARISLWQDGIADYQPREASLTGEIFDVLIAGGGITGITTAIELQRRGKRCILAEARTLCFGTTGGTTAHLNSFFDTPYDRVEKDFGEEASAQLAAAALDALELYRTNVDSYAINCGYALRDGYVYAVDEEQEKMLQRLFDASKRAGVEVSYTDRIPVPVPFYKAVVFRDQAQIHPAAYVHALARAFEEAGGVILDHCLVDRFEGDEILEITTAKGIIKARNLVWATHIPPGVNILHFRCAPYRSYAMAVQLKNGNYPDGLAYDLFDPYHYYRTQEVNGKTYLIAGGEDHKTAHEENTEACFTKLEAQLRNYFDIEEVSFAWSSQYFEPADGLPYIGHLPGNPSNVFVATGFSGNGMTYSHIAAPLIADLVEGKKTPLAQLFSPSRVKPVAGFSNFIKENADVVKEFFAKRLDREKLETLAELAPGEGKLVKYEGKTLALYKDEEGGLHAVSTVCPHAGCAVGWNSAEKSWDCPCHGSRFSVDGEILTGPTRKGLDSISLEKMAGSQDEES